MVSPSRQIYMSLQKHSVNSGHMKADEVFYSSRLRTKRLPLFIDPAYVPFQRANITVREGKLDLNDYLVRNPESTFLIRVTGNSMIKAGINSGDILVVDRSLEAENGKIVVAAINDQLLVKRLQINEQGTVLVAENDQFSPIIISEDDKFDIWGVVTSVIKSV